MSTILEKIIETKRKEVGQLKESTSIIEIEKQIEQRKYYTSFKKHIQQSETGIIAEFKRKSPSKDWIFKDAKVQNIIPYYSLAGAAAISVLTDSYFFGGCLSDLEMSAKLTTTPILRKDFIVDELQIFQACASGASAILLIAAALTPKEVETFTKRAKELKLEVLLEIHNEEELKHINSLIDVVGVNNRNLKTFVTDIETSTNLYDKIPNDFVKISESGISSIDAVVRLRKVGYDGFLIGESFMKTDNPGHALSTFIHRIKEKI